MHFGQFLAVCVGALMARSAFLIGGVLAAADAAPKNLLYLVYDDLRPDLGFYGADFMNTPNLDKLAKSGLVFDRAYCQQPVCGPSRMSFTTGRRPNTTKTWNFLNHFRQAECSSRAGVVSEGTPLSGTRHASGISFSKDVDGDVGKTGGAGQCCSDCSARSDCRGWSIDKGTCTLFGSVSGQSPCSSGPCQSGDRGAMPAWTPLPENLRKHGVLTLGVGKYFHDVNSGLGYGSDKKYPAGTGLPPQADPVSWSNVSVQNRNLSAVQATFGHKYGQLFDGCEYTGGKGFGYVNGMDGCWGAQQGEYCSEESGVDGSLEKDTFPFCDFVTYKDAIDKLRFAAEQVKTKGQSFFLAVGIRRPHLSWRVPKPYANMYAANNTALPKQKTMDSSIDPIAWTEFGGLGGESPFVYTNSDDDVRAYRAAYYSAVSWGDYVAGQVLDELDALGLTDTTAVVMHSDHGFHLGEYNMWEKRTLWENAARVPLVIRVPWMPKASVGMHTPALVELVDIYKTVCDLLEVPLPEQDAHAVEGTSLVPLLEHPMWTHLHKDVALTTYPRCPSDESQPWKHNECIHNVERTDFSFMGYSMLVDHSDGCSYRYTEWVRWTAEVRPDWSEVRAVELYNHTGILPKGVYEFDSFENENLAQKTEQALLNALSSRLRQAFAEGTQSMVV